MELYQLKQLTAIYRCKTLSKAAEELHLSQPALSRSMQKLEEELQVPLFIRQKNKIEFNENGELAVSHAEKILDQLKNMTTQIRQFDRSRHTISVGSCAPAPLWEIVPMLSDSYSAMTISTEIKENEVLEKGLEDGTYQLIILPYPLKGEDTCYVKFGEEHLYFSLPPAHPLSGSKSLRFGDLNGETMLLRSRIGFWNHVKEKMPDTHFLVQEENYAFDELVKASALPSFTTDLVTKREGIVSNRILIPISDEEASVTYYCVCKLTVKKELNGLFYKI